jgi:predicted RNase H-like HicB family nuclease
MKNTTLSLPVVVLKTETGYNAFSPAVDGCVATAKTVDTVLKRIKEALAFHLEGERLVKSRTKRVNEALNEAFEDYGTEALYASVEVVAT